MTGNTGNSCRVLPAHRIDIEFHFHFGELLIYSPVEETQNMKRVSPIGRRLGSVFDRTGKPLPRVTERSYTYRSVSTKHNEKI